MKFEFVSYAPVQGWNFKEVDGQKILYMTGHVTSKMVECPYDGKFEQTDYNQEIILPKGSLPETIEAELPEILNQWVIDNYPNT